jgi:hypothetical protein
VQLAASSRRQAGRAARRNSVGREGKERILWDPQIAGKAESKPQSPFRTLLWRRPRCFVVAVQPTSAGHALGQAMTCTCLPCQHGNYLALQPGLSRASEQRLPTIDQRPATSKPGPFSLLPQPLCISFVPAGCVIASSTVWAYGFPTTRCSPVSLWVYLSISVSVCKSASVAVSACSKLR